MPVTGIVDGEIHALGKNNQLTDLVGAVQGHDIGVRGVILDSVKADLTHSDNLTNIIMVGNMGTGSFSGYGSIQNGQVDATVSGNALPLTSLSPIIGEDVAGTLSTSINVKGALDNPNVIGTVWGQEVSL